MIFRSPYPDITIPNIALTPFILQRVQQHGKRPAFIDAGSGKTVTFIEFHDSVVAVSSGLARFGFQKGDVFAIYSPNCIEYAIAFHAVVLLGGIVTTANPLNTAQELSSQLKDSGAQFILTVPSLLKKVSEAMVDTKIKEIFVIGDADSGIPFASLSQESGPLTEVSIKPSDDVAAMPYSSGTTGFPKGVMLTHRNLVSNLLQIEGSRVFDPTDVVVCVLPLFHIYGMMVIMNECLYLGCTTVMMQRFDLEQLLAAIKTYRITIAPLVPPIVLSLAKQKFDSTSDISSLRTIFSAAAPLGSELTAECSERFGCVIKQGYGMTEASPATHMSPAEPDQIKPGTVGVCVPNTEWKIVDTEGQAAGIGELGEVFVRGPQVMKGYLNRPEDTAATIDADGWLRTGDIGFADERGNLTIVDRVKELIKYKGFQVAPAELEALLLTHPMIADAAVIPCIDEEAGEIPKAFIVLKGQFALEEIQQYVNSRIAPHKKIRRIEAIDKIPKSPSGKILRRVLVERERNR